MSHSTCFDACKSINPNNPEKVAETLPEIFELLAAMRDYTQISSDAFNAKYPKIATRFSGLMWNNLSFEAKVLLEKATDNLPF